MEEESATHRSRRRTGAERDLPGSHVRVAPGGLGWTEAFSSPIASISDRSNRASFPSTRAEGPANGRNPNAGPRTPVARRPASDVPVRAVQSTPRRKPSQRRRPGFASDQSASDVDYASETADLKQFLDSLKGSIERDDQLTQLESTMAELEQIRKEREELEKMQSRLALLKDVRNNIEDLKQIQTQLQRRSFEDSDIEAAADSTGREYSRRAAAGSTVRMLPTHAQAAAATRQRAGVSAPRSAPARANGASAQSRPLFRPSSSTLSDADRRLVAKYGSRSSGGGPSFSGDESIAKSSVLDENESLLEEQFGDLTPLSEAEADEVEARLKRNQRNRETSHAADRQYASDLDSQLSELATARKRVEELRRLLQDSERDFQDGLDAATADEEEDQASDVSDDESVAESVPDSTHSYPMESFLGHTDTEQEELDAEELKQLYQKQERTLRELHDKQRAGLEYQRQLQKELLEQQRRLRETAKRELEKLARVADPGAYGSGLLSPSDSASVVESEVFDTEQEEEEEAQEQQDDEPETDPEAESVESLLRRADVTADDLKVALEFSKTLPPRDQKAFFREYLLHFTRDSRRSSLADASLAVHASSSVGSLQSSRRSSFGSLLQQQLPPPAAGSQAGAPHSRAKLREDPVTSRTRRSDSSTSATYDALGEAIAQELTAFAGDPNDTWFLLKLLREGRYMKDNNLEKECLSALKELHLDANVTPTPRSFSESAVQRTFDDAIRGSNNFDDFEHGSGRGVDDLLSDGEVASLPPKTPRSPYASSVPQPASATQQQPSAARRSSPYRPDGEGAGRQTNEAERRSTPERRLDEILKNPEAEDQKARQRFADVMRSGFSGKGFDDDVLDATLSDSEEEETDLGANDQDDGAVSDFTEVSQDQDPQNYYIKLVQNYERHKARLTKNLSETFAINSDSEFDPHMPVAPYPPPRPPPTAADSGDEATAESPNRRRGRGAGAGLAEERASHEKSVSFGGVLTKDESDSRPSDRNGAAASADDGELATQEYFEEIITNEAIVKELDAKIDAMLSPRDPPPADPAASSASGASTKTVSAADANHLYDHVAALVQNRTDVLDEKLSTALRQILVSYIGKNLAESKTQLVKEVSDTLYDEMVFSKVLHKIDNSYLQEIQELQNAERQLLEQREDDLARLQEERANRLFLKKSDEEAAATPDAKNTRSPRSEDAVPNGFPQFSNLWTPGDKKETVGTRSPRANGPLAPKEDAPRRYGGVLSGRDSISSQDTAFSGLSRAATKDSYSDAELSDAEDIKADGEIDQGSVDPGGLESEDMVTIDDLPLPAAHVPLSAARRREIQAQAIQEQGAFLRSIGASENHQFKGHSHGPGHHHAHTGTFDHLSPTAHPVGTTVAPSLSAQPINAEHMAAFENVIAQYLGISPKSSDAKPDAPFRHALEQIATGEHSSKMPSTDPTTPKADGRPPVPSGPRNPTIVATPPSGRSPRNLSVVVPGKGTSTPTHSAAFEPRFSPSSRSPKVLTPGPQPPEPDTQAARSPRAASPGLPRFDKLSGGDDK